MRIQIGLRQKKNNNPGKAEKKEQPRGDQTVTNIINHNLVEESAVYANDDHWPAGHIPSRSSDMSFNYSQKQDISWLVDIFSMVSSWRQKLCSPSSH